MSEAGDYWEGFYALKRAISGLYPAARPDMSAHKTRHPHIAEPQRYLAGATDMPPYARAHA